MSYRHDLDVAEARSPRRDRDYLRVTRYGTIEYADHGDGDPVLACHPLLGGFDIGLRMVDVYLGESYRAVAPSRFGYLGSSLPDRATAEDQADAYEVLLDALDLRRVTVFGYSAGGPSAMQFALRHRDRTAALVLLAPPLPGKAGRPPKVVAQAIFGSDAFWWSLKRFAPSVFTRVLGMPKHYKATVAEQLLLDDVAASLFPIAPRSAARCSIPTSPHLVYRVSHSRTSQFPPSFSMLETTGSPRSTTRSTPQRGIRDASFVPFDRGGHLLLGREVDVRDETGRFLTADTADIGAYPTDPSGLGWSRALASVRRRSARRD